MFSRKNNGLCKIFNKLLEACLEKGAGGTYCENRITLDQSTFNVTCLRTGLIDALLQLFDHPIN